MRISLPIVIIDPIGEYAKEWMLRPWAVWPSESEAYLSNLSINIRALDYLAKRPHLIDQQKIAANSAANHITFGKSAKKRLAKKYGIEKMKRVVIGLDEYWV